MHIQLRFTTNIEITAWIKLQLATYNPDIKISCKQYSGNYAIQCKSIEEYNTITKYLSKQYVVNDKKIMPYISGILQFTLSFPDGDILSFYICTDGVEFPDDSVLWRSDFDMLDTYVENHDLENLFNSF